ncbi:MAG: response regulator [Pseudomonadota bacterium]|nr:response regulator [Pseudomonadota bacterium]MDP1904551.1 response regulator [Pseudomonadota bacterium]MDP2353250.1 response regulator [Pseudomonadota bacterium]
MPRSDIDPRLMQQLLQTFSAQLEERLQAIVDGLLALEQGATGEARTKLLDAIFRAAHNIKGAARGVGLERSAELAHALEDLFSALKRETVANQPGLLELCLSAVDGMRRLVEADTTNSPISQASVELLQRVRAVAAGAAPPPASKTTPAAAARPLSDTIRLPVARLDRIADLAEELQASKIRVDDHYQASRHQHDLAQRLKQLWEQLNQSRHDQMAYPSEIRNPKSEIALDRHLLIEASDLILEIERLADSMQRGLRATVAQLRPLATGLREDVRDLRMVPAESVLKPLVLTVRDLARDLGKRAELLLEGERLEMDRAILDALRDPLMHLLRNAVDHGIEAPTQRRLMGKTETGLITLRLEREGQSVVITVSDDGAGVDSTRVRSRIRELGLASEEEVAALPSRALLDYLFRPGFSTRSVVSEVSGRGVGLDVVQVNLQALGGRIALETELNGGTRFRLCLPLTLASDHGLLVRAAGQVFALPSLYVQRILELTPAQILEVSGSQAVTVDDTPVPLRDLASLLGHRGTLDDYAELISVVVIQRGWQRVALRVDHVLGEREMVVKPLAPPLVAVRHIAGGTLGRDGDILLVLAVADLLASALGASGRVVSHAHPEARPAPRILIADDSITTRTLEQSILENAGYRVQVAADGEQAWEALHSGSFDLLITDVEMPELDGFELTRRIRADAHLADLPVVIVTSLGSEEHRRRGLEVRADAYVVKSSFETRELLEVVGQLL